MEKRIVSFILVLMMFCTSLGDLLPGIGCAAAEGETRQAATPTDLQPAKVQSDLPAKSAQRRSPAVEEASATEVTDAAVSAPKDMTLAVFAAEPDLHTALTANSQQEAEPVLMQAAAPVTAQQAAGKEAATAEEKPASLQEIILEKIKAAVSLDGILTVSLPVNTVFEGNVTISKEKGKTYGKNFRIDLQAEGDGDDHLQADGTTVLKGNLLIEGISVRLMGLVMAAGKAIQVTDAKVQYFGTKADDQVSVEMKGSADVTVNTGAGDDSVQLKDEAAKGKAVINTGDGDDTVEADLRTAGYGVTIRTGEGKDSVSLTNKGDVSSPVGKVKAELGGGADEVLLHLSLSDAVSGVMVDAGEGDDHEHLSGTLGEDGKDGPRAAGDEDSMTLKGAGGRKLAVFNSNVEIITDDLKNKLTKNIVLPDGSGSVTVSDAFTNYVLNVPSGDLRTVTVKSKNGKKLALSSVLIDTAADINGKSILKISQNAVISAVGLGLTLRGQHIQVDGTLKADQITIEALAGTGMYARNLSDQFAAYQETTNAASAAGQAALDAAADLFSVEDEASLTIGSTGRVLSRGDVILAARVAQRGGIFTPLSDVNIVNVKIGKATVDIAGQVRAGYDESSGRWADGVGSVKITAEAELTAGYNEDGKTTGGFPLAVNVLSAETSVNVHRGASIEAAGNVEIGSRTNIKAASVADSGLFGLPVSAAVSVVNNESHTTVNGNVTARKGGVDVYAEANTDIQTAAEKGDGHESMSGGFVAVTVALQDAKAVIGSAAKISAPNGQVTVNSTGKQKVNNQAVSGAAEVENHGEEDSKELITKLYEVLWPAINSKISSPNSLEKMDAAMKKLLVSNKSIRLDEDANRKGDVKVETGAGNRGPVAKITTKPWPGYKVSRIIIHGYDDGDDAYTVETVEVDEEDENTETVSLTKQHNIVFVEYEEIDQPENENEWTPDDLFNEKERNDDADLQQMIDDLNNGTDDVSKKTDQAIEDAENETAIKLTLEKSEDGAILTYDTEEDGKSLSEVYAGQQLRLIPNPNTGKKLRQGGLKVTYKVKTEEEKDGKKTEKTETKTVIVNPDGKGRYLFTVPGDAIPDEGMTVKAEFTDSDSDAEADETQNQATGAVAIVVSSNDSQALIEKAEGKNAGVTAKSVAVKNDSGEEIINLADGTAVGKPDGEDKEEKDEDAIERPESKDQSSYGEKAEYGLILDATENGQVKAAKDGAYVYRFTFTPEAAEGYSVVNALLTYYEDGKRKTVELTKNADGKTFSLDLTDSDLGMDKGSTARVSFTFGKKNTYGVTVSTSEAQTLLAHPIQITTNTVKETKAGQPDNYGTVLFTPDRKNGVITAYKFTVSPNAQYGYKLDGGLKAKWKDADGKTHETELTEKGGKWILDTAEIPDGVPIQVSGVFAEDFRELKAAEDISNGSVQLHDENVKKADKPIITVKADPGYALKSGSLKVRYTLNGLKKELTLENGKIQAVKGRKDVYTFTVPDADEGSITVDAAFTRKQIGIYAGEHDDDEDYVLSEKRVAPGESVTVTPSESKIKAGYKVGSITVKANSADVKPAVDGDTFTVPEGTPQTAKLTVTKVELVLKDIEIKEAKLENGSVRAEIPRADRGEDVTVTVSPDANFKVKKGTLKAVLKAKDGSYSEEIYLKRKDDSTYTFTVPESIEDPTGVTVTFTGEFELGESDSSKVDTSLGAGIAVTVANSEGRAEIRGRVNAEGNIRVESEMNGGARTEAKAGYSKGNIGIGGAVAVQVAGLNSKVLVHNSADLSLGGKLDISSDSDLTFLVNADASGSKESGKTGVGAGIAVAVNGADTYAAVQDKTKIAGTEESGVKAISVNANQKVDDKVTAKAGAAGGTAVVPVAAVDVTGVSAEAYLGRLSKNSIEIAEGVSVTASVTGKHTIEADAAADGKKGTGIGAAVSVDVISDTAVAKLNEGITAGEVTVAANTVSTVENTATASASGGKKDGKSADSQADNLTGTAAKMAGKNGSSSVKPGAIDKATKNRQKSETSEGSVGVAGAVAVNVQTSTSAAEIMDGVRISSSGLLAVTSANGTTAKVKANASTTNSDIGVGVGVGLNIIFLNNLAEIGNSEIKAAMLKVAATTKRTEPEEEKEEEKEEKPATTDALAEDLGKKAGEYVYLLVKEIGLDQVVGEDILGQIVNPVVTAAVDDLIKTTGIGDLLGDGGLDQKIDKIKGMLTDAKEGLMSIADELISPFMEALDDVMELGSLSSKQRKEIMDALKDAFANRLKTYLTGSGKKLLSSVKDGLIEYLEENTVEILAGAIENGVGDQLGKLFDKAKEIIGDTVKKELKSAVQGLLKESLNALSSVKIPGMTAENADRVARAFSYLKDAYKNDSVENILASASNRVTELFKKNVFDFEKMIKTISETDFSSKIADSLRSAAKKAAVTLTNTALGALSEKLDLGIEAKKAEPTGHVIDTQAIAGAGARDVGVAGSVAITVLNSETSAVIRDSQKAVVVDENMTVAADELRSVRNTASAALDAKGNASANTGAGDAANQDVADGDRVIGNDTVTLKLGGGVSGAIREGDLQDRQPKIYLKLEEGYRMPEGDKASFSYTDTAGTTVLGEVKLMKQGDEWVLDTAAGDLADPEKIDFSKGITLELKPAEILKGIQTPDILTDGRVKVEEGAVTVSVPDREVEDNQIKARVGETVQIRIARGEGRKVSAVGYSWKDADGRTHDVEMNPETKNPKKEQAFTLVSSNEKELIYSFTMPDGEVTGIVVAFEKGEDADKGTARTAAKDDTGKGVGVGAAFSLVYGDAKVTAMIGKRSVKAGDLTVTAESEHQENIAAAAGTDPVEGGQDLTQMKKTAVDASVALNILDETVTAGAHKETTVTIKTTETSNGDLIVKAAENAVTETQASAFSVGGKTAVGASAAINISNSGISARLEGGAKATGKAQITAVSHSEDTTKAIASAMGADIGRNLEKLGEKADNMEEKADKLLDGSYVDKMGEKDGTQTSGRINKRLDEKKGSSGSATNGNASTSTNALRSLGVETADEDAGNEAAAEAEKQIEEKTGKQTGLTKEKTSTKWQVAAAVGVTVASHEAGVRIGAIQAGEITAAAENTGNFNTMGTGAAMSLAEKANSIAAGVAVSVNSNKATVNAAGDLFATTDGEINLRSRLTQNLDGDFAGKLAAQSLSGSVAGSNSAVSIGGAVSVVVSKAESQVNVQGGSSGSRRILEGGNITVEATDKSKLAARAGGLSISKGSSVGLGIASTTIVSRNCVTADLGSNILVSGGSFKLNAEKQAVTFDDYKNLIDLKYVITDSSGMSGDDRKQAKTGLIDIHKDEGEDSYKLDVNLSSEKLLEAVDGLNFLSSQNTYAEAIAGSVMAGGNKEGSKASVAGSVAVAVTDNVIRTGIGSRVEVKLKANDTFSGDMTVNASNAATTRIIAGSLSAAPAKASVGAVISVLVDRDTVNAESGESLYVNAAGNYSQKAETTGEIQVFTAAMSAASGKAKAAAGGAVNAIITLNESESKLGYGTNIKAGGNAEVSSRTAMDLIAISGSAQLTVGSGVAAGGTVNVIYDRATSRTNLLNRNTITAGKDLLLSSETKNRTLSGTASLSVAAAAKNGKAGAGVANVIIGRSAADVTVGSKTNLTATEGDLKVGAANDAWMLNASAAAAGGKDTAVGAAFNINVVDRKANVNLNDGSLTAGSHVYAQATGKDTDIMAGLSVAGSLTGSAGSGNVVGLYESNEIGMEIASGMNIKAGKSAVLESRYEDLLVGAAGSVAASLAEEAIGATVVGVIKNNQIRTSLGKSTVTAGGSGEAVTADGEKAEGIYVGANAKETQVLAGAGVAAASGDALNGVIAVLVNNNAVNALADKAKLETYAEKKSVYREKALIQDTYNDKSYTTRNVSEMDEAELEKLIREGRVQYFDSVTMWYKDSTDISDFIAVERSGGAVTVKANDDTSQLLLAGGLNASSGSGAGAAVVTLVSGKEVNAKAHDMSANLGINVAAENRDDLKQFAVSAGISGGTAVQIGAAVQVLRSKVKADVASDVKTHGNFSLTAQNNTELYNVAAAVGIGGGMAVSPVGTVTYFEGESTAQLSSGASVTADGGITVSAQSNKENNMASLGVTGGSNAISGAATVLLSHDSAAAVVEDGTDLTTKGDVNVSAQGDFKLRAASAAIAGGSIGVGVNAVVGVLKSSTLAELRGTALAQNVSVEANAKRDVISAVASLGAGQIGGGVSALVLVAGTKMSQDAADMIAYGNAPNKTEKAGFDGDAFLSLMEQNGIEGKYYSGSGLSKDISGDLEGNGHYESRETVGTSSGSGEDRKSKTGFDGASGYRSSDFDRKDFDDNGENIRGENLSAEDTEDVKKAREMNTYSYQDDPLDKVVARITETAKVEAGQVNVTARQSAAADLLGASVGAGQVGTGISTAVAILRSNVIASEAGSVSKALNGVNVIAESVAGSLEGDSEAEARDAAVLDLMSNRKMRGDDEEETEQDQKDKQSLIDDLKEKLNPSNRALRTFALAAGAGQAGVAVAASVLLTDNVTQAVLSGTVTESGQVGVKAIHDYGTVLAGTGSLAAGQAAANASVSVAQANGTVNASVGRDTQINTAGLDVDTVSNTGVDAVAVTAGVGVAAVDAGVALAFNHLKQHTAILGGANVTADDVNVRAVTEGSSNAYLLGVAIGGVGVTLNAAVTDMDAEVKTSVGEADYDQATVTAKKNLTVRNMISSSVKPAALSAAIGGVAVGGNALLAFNDSTAEAAVRNAIVKGGNVQVISNLKGTADSSLAALQVGGVAVGLSVNYADMNADNRAIVSGSSVTTTGDADLVIRTNDEDLPHGTSAFAETISADIGVLTVGLNAAIARNSSKSYAVFENSDADLGGSLIMHGYGENKAQAELKGASIGLARAAATAVVALNDADSRTVVDLNSLKAGGSVKLEATQDAETGTDILTGGGSLFSAVATVGVAYGRTKSQVDATVRNDASMAELIVNNTNRDKAESTINNAGIDIISASALVGAAFSQDLADTKVTLLGSNNTIRGDAALKTVYDMSSKAEVTPSSGGVKVSAAELALNLAMAKNTAYAGTEFTVGSDSDAESATTVSGNLEVSTTGTANTSAKVNEAKVTVNSADLGAVMANSNLAMNQAAVLNLNKKLTVTKDVTVKSVSGGGTAWAGIGTSGKDKDSGISLTLLNTKTNTATARENLESTAGIIGAGTAGSVLNAWKLDVRAGSEDGGRTGLAEAHTDGNRQGALLTAGNLEARAFAGERANVVFRNLTANITRLAELTAKTNTRAYAVGNAPGKLSVIDGGSSNIKAQIGTEKNAQAARSVIDSGAKLNAGSVSILSENKGDAETKMEKASAYSLGSVSDSSQPTESWYETVVSVGDKAEISAADGEMNIYSRTLPRAKSVLNADSLGLLLNVDKMRGENKITENNNLMIGNSAVLKSKGGMNLMIESAAEMTAETTFNGGFGFAGGSEIKAANSLTRNAVLQIGNNAALSSADGSVDLENRIGMGDSVRTTAKQNVNSLMEHAKATAVTDSRITSKMIVGAGAKITGGKAVYIENYAGGKASDGGNGYFTKVEIDAGGFKLNSAPTGKARTNLYFDAQTLINPEQGEQAEITAKGGQVVIRVSNKGLKVRTESNVYGSGAVGGLDSTAVNHADLNNVLWVDNTDFSSTGGTWLRVSNGSAEGEKARLETYARANLKAGAGYVNSTSAVEGTWSSYIRTHNRNGVTAAGSGFNHIAETNVSYTTDCNTDSWALIIENSYPRSSGITRRAKCDFCDNADSTGTNSMVSAKNYLKKALEPLWDFQRTRQDAGMSKVGNEAEDIESSMQMYTLALEVMLKDTLEIAGEKLSETHLWYNLDVHQDVYLLPNATRLYTIGDMRLQYVSDVFSGNLLGDGNEYQLEIVTALTPGAADDPQLPVGTTGSMSFRDGMLRLPSRADFYLYLHEISGEWFIEKAEEGFFQVLNADQEEINECVWGGDLPSGRIMKGLTADGTVKTAAGETGTWKRYWLGDTPDTAPGENDLLIMLLLNGETDELRAFRTTPAGFRENRFTKVSMYLYRDSKSDRDEVERYNIMFFDTIEGDISMVKVVTDVLMDRILETPRPLKIALRERRLDGGRLKAYSIIDSFFTVLDGTKGSAEAFDGFYRITFDGDVFESDYERIEEISTDHPTVILKPGQKVWARWDTSPESGDACAIDPNGQKWHLDQYANWQMDEEPAISREEPQDAA